MKRIKMYQLYKDITNIYYIDNDYIFSINYLSIKYSIPVEFLTKMLGDFNMQKYITYTNKKKAFKLTYLGYKYIDSIIQSERQNVLVIVSILTSIIVGILSFLRS